MPKLYIECPTCDGSGEVLANNCFTCHGVGFAAYEPPGPPCKASGQHRWVKITMKDKHGYWFAFPVSLEHPVFCADCGASAQQEESLPTIKEMSGSIPNITGGLSLRDYLNEIRGQQEAPKG